MFSKLDRVRLHNAPKRSRRFLQVDEDIVRLLLPYLLHGIGTDADTPQVTSEYRAASYMVLVQLCSAASLAQDLLQGSSQETEIHEESDLQQQNFSRASHSKCPDQSEIEATKKLLVWHQTVLKPSKISCGLQSKLATASEG